VDEADFPGHLGVSDAEAPGRLALEKGRTGGLATNPGGLIGVWAEENTRDAIFDAMQRREVFGTSGPRIRVRFHGGWEYDEDLCDAPDRLARADRAGVPMGRDLPAPADPDSAVAAPSFVVLAQADPGTRDRAGTPLQRLQVVKGWVGDDGDHHQRVYDVAGNPDNGAQVDLETCEPIGSGYTDLCAVWRDPDFDAQRRAVYYLRALENPSCRYSQRVCIALEPEESLEGCAYSHIPRTIQERAWSSPIWYSP
jgi:hypothetical protein